MATPTPVKNAKVEMETREAGRAPPKKQLNDGKGHDKSGSGENDIQKVEGKEDGRDKDGGTLSFGDMGGVPGEIEDVIAQGAAI